MKNLSILSILLLASASAVAMEGRWKKKPEEAEQQSKVPSLKNLCFEAMKNVTDSKPIKDFYQSDLSPDIWSNIPQYLVDCDNDEYVNRLITEKYPANVKAAMIKRLTLDSQMAEELFKQVLDPENHDEDKHLVACALFVKNKDLQTWEIGKKLAASMPITLEAAQKIIETIHTTANLYALYEENESGLPEEMLNFDNEELFKKAFYQLAFSNPISVADQNFLGLRLPCYFNFTGDYNHQHQSLTPIEQTYSIHEDQSNIKSFRDEDGEVQSNIKSLHDENRNLVCYLPIKTKHIAVSKDKKWCVTCESQGKLTIINLEEKVIVATVEGRIEFGAYGIQFDENNQLFNDLGHLTTYINLPYFYLENHMSLPEIMCGILFKQLMPNIRIQAHLSDFQRDVWDFTNLKTNQQPFVTRKK